MRLLAWGLRTPLVIASFPKGITLYLFPILSHVKSTQVLTWSSEDCMKGSQNKENMMFVSPIKIEAWEKDMSADVLPWSAKDPVGETLPPSADWLWENANCNSNTACQNWTDWSFCSDATCSLKIVLQESALPNVHWSNNGLGKIYSMEYISRYKDEARLVQALYFAKFISL